MVNMIILLFWTSIDCSQKQNKTHAANVPSVHSGGGDADRHLLERYDSRLLRTAAVMQKNHRHTFPRHKKASNESSKTTSSLSPTNQLAVKYTILHSTAAGDEIGDQ